MEYQPYITKSIKYEFIFVSGRPMGVKCVITTVDGAEAIGVSRCDIFNGDEFSAQFGISLAHNRATFALNTWTNSFFANGHTCTKYIRPKRQPR